MKEERHNGLLANVMTRLNAWIIVALVSAFSNVLLVIILATSNNPEKTIVVPPDLNLSFWVQGDKVDPKYLEQMGTYFANYLLTYNPDNAPGQFQVVLRFADPQAYVSLNKRLTSDLDDIKSKQLGSVFYVTQDKIVGKHMLLFGQKLDLMQGQVIGNRLKGYQLDFDYRNGHLYVKNFNEVVMGAGGIGEYEKTLRLTAPAAPATSGQENSQ